MKTEKVEKLEVGNEEVEVKEEIIDIDINGVVLKLHVPDMSKLERAILDDKYTNITAFKMDLSKYRKDFVKDATFQAKILNPNQAAKNGGDSKVKTY